MPRQLIAPTPRRAVVPPPGIALAAAHSVIAVPARNEAAHLAACLRALGQQAGAPPPAIVLLLNNCSDASQEVARGIAATLPATVHILRHDLPPAQAHAGMARRLALQEAARLAPPDGVLLTTDADSAVPPDWLAANLAALQAGADVVCGRAVIDPRDALDIPDHLHRDDAREQRYAALLEELACLADPDAADPWLRHNEESGASIAVTRAAYLASGGMPCIPTGEDRAFLAALRRIDARIRHAPEIRVVVSGRLYGRAKGGMADTMRRRMIRQDDMIDDRLEAPLAAWRRARLRAACRAAWASRSVPARLAPPLQLARDELAALLRMARFGAAWEAVEAASPTLIREPVALAELDQVIAVATRLLRAIRAASEHPAGSLADAMPR